MIRGPRIFSALAPTAAFAARRHVHAARAASDKPEASGTRSYTVEPHGPEMSGTFPHRVTNTCRASPQSVTAGGLTSSGAPPPEASRPPQRPIPTSPPQPEAMKPERLRRLAAALFPGRSEPEPGRLRRLWAGITGGAARGSTCAPTSAQNQPQAEVTDASRKAELDRMEDLVAQLSPERRRFLLVAAAAHEWYGTERVCTELRKADNDADARVSSEEYREWVARVFRERCGLTRREFILTAINTGIPFVAFGFLDNSVMILSGDMIDRALGSAFHLSAMAAAGLGGVCSGTMGIQMHGLAERAVQALGFTPPALSQAQRRHPSFLRATHVGGTVGVCIGLSLGMLPLLLIGDDDTGADASH